MKLLRLYGFDKKLCQNGFFFKKVIQDIITNLKPNQKFNSVSRNLSTKDVAYIFSKKIILFDTKRETDSYHGLNHKSLPCIAVGEVY